MPLENSAYYHTHRLGGVEDNHLLYGSKGLNKLFLCSELSGVYTTT